MTDQKKIKVAIVKGRYEYGEFDATWLHEGVEWFEVNEQDYKALVYYASIKDYRVLVSVPVVDLLEEARKHYAQQQIRIKKAEEESAARRKRDEAKKAKKLEEQEANRIKDIEALAAKAGFNLVPKT